MIFFVIFVISNLIINLTLTKKQTIMKILFFALFTIISLNVSAQYFEGFSYGMSKQEQKDLVMIKVDQGLFVQQLGSKRHVILEGLSFESTLKRTFYIAVVFQHFRKELNNVRILPMSDGAAFAGGMSRKKASILKREFEDYIESLGYTMDMELEQTTRGYYRLYMPFGTIDLDDLESHKLATFR